MRIGERIDRVAGIDHILDQPRAHHDRPAQDIAKQRRDRSTPPGNRAARGTPNGITAEIKAGYLQPMAQPASRPIKHQIERREIERSRQPRTAAQTSAA